VAGPGAGAVAAAAHNEARDRPQTRRPGVQRWPTALTRGCTGGSPTVNPWSPAGRPAHLWPGTGWRDAGVSSSATRIPRRRGGKWPCSGPCPVDFQHAARKDPSGKAQAVRHLDRVPPWLAPETSTGLLDDRADLYGVGYMCAAMLLGRNPAAEEIAARARSQAAPAAAPGGPSSAAVRGSGRRPRLNVWEVLATATHPSPARRFRSAREMLGALNRASWTLL